MQTEPASGQTSIQLLPARLEDVDTLYDIEIRCFDTDRLSKRSFRWMIQKGNCDFILARDEEEVVGYILVLYHRGTHLARLYSFAVTPERRGRGIADILMQHGEKLAVDRNCIYMRLEVHSKNQAAIRFYERYGYHPFGLFKDYYEDHADALRYQKRILYPDEQLSFFPIPYYQQTTDFTCGPASLIMAMQALDESITPDRSLELQLWREATTIYMTSGHGGCSPPGLALAAWRRHFKVEVWLNSKGPLFLDGVRSEKKKTVMSLVHEDFIEQIKKTDIVLHYEEMNLSQLDDCLDKGGIPLVLISSYHFTRSKAPHWVVVSGADETFIYIHDPDEDVDSYRTRTDNLYLPIAREVFNKAFRFGQSGLRTAVIIYPATEDKD